MSLKVFSPVIAAGYWEHTDSSSRVNRWQWRVQHANPHTYPSCHPRISLKPKTLASISIFYQNTSIPKSDTVMYSLPVMRRGVRQEIPVRLTQDCLNQRITTELHCFSSRLFLCISLVPVIHTEWLFFLSFLIFLFTLS